MPTAKDSKVDIVLSGPEDWVGWNREFTAKMKLLQLHDYLVHKTELLDEPPAKINAIKVHATQRNRRVAEAKAGRHTDYMNHDDDDDPEAENASQSSDSETLEDPTPAPEPADQTEESAPPPALPAPPAAEVAAVAAAKRAKEAKIKKTVREVQDYFKNNQTAIINELVRNYEAGRKA